MTGYFFQIQSKCVDKGQTTEELQVKLSDGATITSTHTVLLDLPQLPMKARRAHIFPNIKHASLSISMLYEEGCMSIFDDEKVYIVKDGTVLLHGFKDKYTRLYMVNITKT